MKEQYNFVENTAKLNLGMKNVPFQLKCILVFQNVKFYYNNLMDMDTIWEMYEKG